MAGVDNDQTGNGRKIYVFNFLEIIDVAEFLGQKIPQIFFLGSGKDDHSLWIELLSGQHGANGIKVRIDMAGDDGSGANRSVFQAQVVTPVEIK
jgi:hypothetical protein